MLYTEPIQWKASLLPASVLAMLHPCISSCLKTECILRLVHGIQTRTPWMGSRFSSQGPPKPWPGLALQWASAWDTQSPTPGDLTWWPVPAFCFLDTWDMSTPARGSIFCHPPSCSSAPAWPPSPPTIPPQAIPRITCLRPKLASYYCICFPIHSFTT